MPATIEVTERGRTLSFSFEDVLKYHGGGSPGGAAIAFRAVECALPRLAASTPPQRREIVIETPFKGPGARERFVFRFGYGWTRSSSSWPGAS
jgi:hypothetical protein